MLNENDKWKYKFPSKITTALTQQCCLNPKHLNSVCFSSAVQKQSPKVKLINLCFSGSLGRRDTQATNSSVSQPITSSCYFSNQVPAYIQTKEMNSNSRFMWKTSGLLELTQVHVTLENNQHQVSLPAVSITAAFRSNKPVLCANLELYESTSTPPSTVPVMP